MTAPNSNPEAFWNNQLDRLEQFVEGARIRIISGRRRGRTGTVEATVFQKTVDYPDEYAHGYHVTLDDGTWIKVRQDQVLSEHF